MRQARFFRLSILTTIPLAIAASDIVHWTLPSNASNAITVPKSYIGFGIEMKSWPDFAGVGSPNHFTNYMLNQLASRTGYAPIHIRLGGTSGDNTIYDPNQEKAVHATPDPGTKCGLHTNVTLGSAWVTDTFAHLNSSYTRFTVFVPLARKNISNGIEFARACINAMPRGINQVAAIEIGNEPNLYPVAPPSECGPHDRASNWGILDYAREWRDYATKIVAGIGVLGGESRWFQGYSVSSGYVHGEWDLDAERWNALSQGDHVKTISQHYYQVHAENQATDYPPDHANLVKSMNQVIGSNLAFLENRDVPFVLGEVGTVISTSNSHQNSDLYNRLGSALWTLDFVLYGMSLGTQRVSMQMASTFPISAFHFAPPASSHAVHANFYGMAAAADFIGSDTTAPTDSSPLRIQRLPLDNHPNIVGYTGFTGPSLSKVMILNLNFWNQSVSSTRPERQINLSNFPPSVTQVRVSRLTAANGASGVEVRWAGKYYTAENGGTEVTDGVHPRLFGVNNGALAEELYVQASEAVLVEVI